LFGIKKSKKEHTRKMQHHHIEKQMHKSMMKKCVTNQRPRLCNEYSRIGRQRNPIGKIENNELKLIKKQY